MSSKCRPSSIPLRPVAVNALAPAGAFCAATTLVTSWSTLSAVRYRPPDSRATQASSSTSLLNPIVEMTISGCSCAIERAASHGVGSPHVSSPSEINTIDFSPSASAPANSAAATSRARPIGVNPPGLRPSIAASISAPTAPSSPSGASGRKTVMSSHDLG